MAEKILVVDDEPAISQTLLPALRAQGYAVQLAGTAEEALRLARKSSFDVVLLDLGLPDADGKDIIEPLHALDCRSVMVLSARYIETEKVAALDRGADDYLDKPFGTDELLARIRVALRRGGKPQADAPVFEHRGLRIEFAPRKVTLRGEEVKLSPKEYALLECLARNPGQIVTRRQLLIAGWNSPVAASQNLRVYMTLLRQKLAGGEGAARHIETVTGVGYRLAAEDG